MELTVTFPGGKRVDAQFLHHTIRTDQSPESGGEGSAPEPYLLFLSSIATCAGIYVLSFCRSRGLPTEGLSLKQTVDFHPATGRLQKVGLDILVPRGFPEKYRNALVRAADMCAVKKALQDPPEFEVTTS
jgi:ribosomal protein S12 methylthiotransferase accessory factor